METNPPPSFSLMPLSSVQVNQLAMIANRLAEARATELAAAILAPGGWDERCKQAEAQRDELAAQLATAQEEIGRLNQQLAQIVINSVRMP